MTSTKPWDTKLRPYQEQVRDQVMHLVQPEYRSRLHTMLTKAQVAELEAYAKGKGLQVVWINEQNANDPDLLTDDFVPFQYRPDFIEPYSMRQPIELLPVGRMMGLYHLVQQALHRYDKHLQDLVTMAQAQVATWEVAGVTMTFPNVPTKKSYQHHPAFILDLDNLNMEHPWPNNPGRGYTPPGSGGRKD